MPPSISNDSNPDRSSHDGAVGFSSIIISANYSGLPISLSITTHDVDLTALSAPEAYRSSFRLNDSPDDLLCHHAGGRRIYSGRHREIAETFIGAVIMELSAHGYAVSEPGISGQEGVRITHGLLVDRFDRALLWIECFDRDTETYLVPDTRGIIAPARAIVDSEFASRPPERFTQGPARLLVRWPRAEDKFELRPMLIDGAFEEAMENLCNAVRGREQGARGRASCLYELISELSLGSEVNSMVAVDTPVLSLERSSVDTSGRCVLSFSFIEWISAEESLPRSLSVRIAVDELGVPFLERVGD